MREGLIVLLLCISAVFRTCLAFNLDLKHAILYNQLDVDQSFSFEDIDLPGYKEQNKGKQTYFGYALALQKNKTKDTQ